MKKDDKILTIISAHIHNYRVMKQPLNQRHLEELMQQLSLEKIKLLTNHKDADVQEVAQRIHKQMLS